jgi:hypothetical protein
VRANVYQNRLSLRRTEKIEEIRFLIEFFGPKSADLRRGKSDDANAKKECFQ